MNTKIIIPLLSRTDYTDTHGGFHGDGHAIGIVNLTKSQTNRILKQVRENKYWKKSPTNEQLLVDLYHSMDIYFEPYCPELYNYYWYFYDRHSKATDLYDIDTAFSDDRASVNFTAAIFDKVKQKLIYYELDT